MNSSSLSFPSPLVSIFLWSTSGYYIFIFIITLCTMMTMMVIILEEVVSFLFWVALGFHPRSLKHVEYCLHMMGRVRTVLPCSKKRLYNHLTIHNIIITTLLNPHLKQLTTMTFSISWWSTSLELSSSYILKAQRSLSSGVLLWW